MKSVINVMTVAAVLFAVSPAPVNATLITVGDAINVATSASVTASNQRVLGGNNLASATNNVVSDGTGGANPFDWTQCYLFADRANPDPIYTLDLTWTTGQNLGSLRAYVTPASFSNCSTSAIEFFVKQGLDGSLTSVGSVNVASTPATDVGMYVLAKKDGSWSNVTAVRYQFTADGSGFGPRVAEVLANTVPEPSSILLLVSGLLGLLAYAWRKRR